MTARLTRLDTGAAVLCTVLWGLNFVVIELGLRDFPPLLFAALRFLFAAVPAIFFLRRPHLRWTRIVLLGLLMGVIQFGALFTAIHVGLSAGLASVIIQSQVIFTAVFGFVFLGERPARRRVAGLIVAVVGVCVIGVGAPSAAPILDFALCLLGGAAWGAGNVVTRATNSTQPFALLVYSSAVAPIPLFLLSLLIEGPTTDLRAIAGINAGAIGALAFVTIAGTLVGFGVWYRLVSRYPPDLVAPFTVLVPIVGLLSAWAFLHETATPLELVGALVAVAGLLIVNGRRPAPALEPHHPPPHQEA